MHQFCKLVAVDPHDPGRGAAFLSEPATTLPSLENEIQADLAFGKLTPTNGILTVRIMNHDRELTKGEARKGIWHAILEWEYGIEPNFEGVPIDQKSDIQFVFKSSAEDPLFKTEPNVLAYMYYPIAGALKGICVLNSDYPWTYNGSERSGHWIESMTGKPVQFKDKMYQTWSVFKVTRHELGHGIGLGHTQHLGHTMSSSYDKMAPHNTSRDTARGVAKYGSSTWSERKKTAVWKVLARFL